MNRYSLGACAEVGLAINLIVALEIISLHVIQVEEPNQVKNDCSNLKTLANMYYFMQ